MKPRPPLHGFNHNLRYAGKLYHVQTEDSGLQKLHIDTHVFHGGTIIATRRSEYLADALELAVQKLMQGQHKGVMKELRAGAFDARIELFFGEPVNRELSVEPPDSMRKTDPGLRLLEPAEATPPIAASPVAPAEPAEPARVPTMLDAATAAYFSSIDSPAAELPLPALRSLDSPADHSTTLPDAGDEYLPALEYGPSEDSPVELEPLRELSPPEIEAVAMILDTPLAGYGPPPDAPIVEAAAPPTLASRGSMRGPGARPTEHAIVPPLPPPPPRGNLSPPTIRVSTVPPPPPRQRVPAPYQSSPSAEGVVVSRPAVIIGERGNFTQRSGPNPSATRATPLPQVVRATRQRIEPPVDASIGTNIFGESPVSETSLDEAILAYLAEDLDK